MKLDNLQNNFQQLYAATTRLIVALNEVVPHLPLLQAPHNTSSNFQPPPKSGYPNATAYLSDPPAPPDPSTTPISNQHSATFSNIPWHHAPIGATPPATLPTMNPPNAPKFLYPAPVHLLNIQHKPHTSQQFVSALLRFVKTITGHLPNLPPTNFPIPSNPVTSPC